jgi:hypothetical protein
MASEQEPKDLFAGAIFGAPRGAKQLNVNLRCLCPSGDRMASQRFSSIFAVTAPGRARDLQSPVKVVAVTIERSWLDGKVQIRLSS